MYSYIKYIIGLVTLLISFSVSIEVAGGVQDSEFKVVIDPGHGGKDIGAADNGEMEKNINLGVAKELQSLIKKKLKNVNVVMTRDNDTYLTLQERADIANNSKGDLFISIHTNSVDKKSKNRKTVQGSSVYALGLHKDDNNMAVARRENAVIELEKNFEQKYSGFDPMKDESYIIFEMAQKMNLSQSIKFAEMVEKELVASGRTDRGVHQAGFWVLWATSMPAVLVELDFICNPESAKYLASKKGEKELAEAIFKALEKYYDGWKKNKDHIAESAKNAGKVKDTDKKSNYSEAELIAVAAPAEPETMYEEVVITRTIETAPKKVKADVSGSNYGKGRKRRSKNAKERAKERNYEVAAIPESETISVEVERIEPEISQTVTVNDKKDRQSKQKVKKEKKKRDKDKHSAKVSKIVNVYKIQILASEDKLKKNDPRFCGLSPVTVIKDNGFYKYYYGESTDEQEINLLLKAVKKKIPDAFIVTTMKSYNK